MALTGTAVWCWLVTGFLATLSGSPNADFPESCPKCLLAFSPLSWRTPAMGQLWIVQLEYISLGTIFEPLASGHWEGPGMRSVDFRGSLQLKSHSLVVYEIRSLSFCPKECLSDSNDIGSPALQFPLFFQSAAVECCSGRFLRGQLYCSVNKASCWLQPWLVTPLKHRWKTHRSDQQRAVFSMESRSFNDSGHVSKLLYLDPRFCPCKEQSAELLSVLRNKRSPHLVQTCLGKSVGWE